MAEKNHETAEAEAAQYARKPRERAKRFQGISGRFTAQVAIPEDVPYQEQREYAVKILDKAVQEFMEKYKGNIRLALMRP